MKIGIAAVLVLLFVCCGAAAGANPVYDGGKLEDAVNADNFDVILMDNIQLKGTLNIWGHGTLDLNGHKLEQTGMGSVIKVENWGDLTLMDSSPDSKKSGVITGGNADNGGGVYVAGYSTFTMISGSITGNTATDNGGGVYVEGYGRFNVKGTPFIKDNKRGEDADNVYLFDNTYITVTGKLESGAYIGIINPLKGQFGQNDEVYASDPYKITEDDAACFHPDGSSTLTAMLIGERLFWDSTPTPVYVAKIDESHKYSTVQEAVKAAESGLGTTITMIADSTEKTIEIDKEVTLDLAGHVLSNTGSGSVISISSGGNLTVTDTGSTAHYFKFVANGPWTPYSGTPSSSVDLANFNLTEAKAAEGEGYYVKVTGGVITGGKISNGGGVYVYKSGTFTMNGGTIVGNTANSYGGGVHVAGDGTFTMNGGTIDGNKAYGGGGVFVHKSGTFTMNGGTIVGNSASTGGGGVQVYGGTFTLLSDGTITGNSAAWGGGVFIDNSGRFEMKSGSISGNCACDDGGSGGGGVNVDNGIFNMYDGSITGNIQKSNEGTYSGGGGVRVFKGTFNMSGGSIENNNATCDGGGVATRPNGKFTMSGSASIMNNNAKRYGGGVFVGGPFEMKDMSSITGNTADNNGGGVCLHGVHPDWKAAFNVSGTPVISGNKKGTDTNNVYLPDQKTINVTGELKSGAEIHITNPIEDGTQFGVVDESYTGVTQADADCFIADNSSTQLTAVLNLSASPVTLVWAAGYTVTFDMKGHGTQLPNQTITYGGKVTKPADQTADGYIFNGWFTDEMCTDGNKYDFSTSVTNDITLYAKWTAVIESYTIKFNGNGGTVNPDTLTVGYGVFVNLSEKVTATRDGYTHSGWALSSTGTAIYAAAQNVTDLGDTTLYAVWAKTEELSGINVTVKQDSALQSGATVELKQGSVVINSSTTDGDGKASITGVPKGTYTLVVTNGYKTKTRAVTVPCDDVTINLPTKDIKAEVEVKSEKGTPAVAVNVTDDIVDESGVGKTDKVIVTVIVESKKDGSAPDVQDEIDKIKTLVTDANSKLEYLGIIIEKKVNEISVDPINETVNVLTFIIPYDFTKKHNIKLYRCHEGTSELLNVIQLKPETPTQEGYYLDSSNNQIYLYAKKFSTYSVSYIPGDSPQPTPSSGGSSRSSGASTILPAAPADTQGAQTTRDITAQYAGHTFVGVTAGVLSNPGDVNSEITAAAEIKISTAKAAGIKVTNSKGAPALILTNNAAEGLDTVTFCEVYDIKPSNPNEKLTQVTITVPKADVAASGLTTDDVTIYHFLEEYDIWVPLDTLQITEDEANYYYTAATDGASPFGVLIKKFDAEPVKPGQPVNPQPTSASPLPLAGVIAGLGAAGILFGLRRK